MMADRLRWVLAFPFLSAHVPGAGIWLCLSQVKQPDGRNHNKRDIKLQIFNFCRLHCHGIFSLLIWRNPAVKPDYTLALGGLTVPVVMGDDAKVWLKHEGA